MNFTNNQLGILSLFAILILGSLIVFLMKRRSPQKDYSELSLRMRSWWVIVSLFSFAILGNQTLAFIFVGVISFLALREYISLIPSRRSDRKIFFYPYIAIPIQLYFLSIGWMNMFFLFVPVFGFFLIHLRMVTIGDTKGFVEAAGKIHWGMMICVFNIGHMAAMVTLPSLENQNNGGQGILFFLVACCQLNDVAQYLWGKSFGKRKIIPKVSPNKTWAGFLGGVVSISFVSFLIAPYFTPLSRLESILAGLVIAISGFFGDVVISAVKRDIGVKDSGTTIPGHGGVLDRVDSLTFAAPLFFHFVHYLYY